MHRTKKKGKTSSAATLTDADEYLAAAGEHEEAMGKHRRGDTAKSLRFADRALGVYSEGLAKFPASVDLAYNKARLQLEIATHPAFAAVLGTPVVELLHQALTSHQYVLNLDSENADALFNTAQALTAIAEGIADDDAMSDQDAAQYLQQALEYQAQCFEIQQQGFIRSQEILQQTNRNDGGDGAANQSEESSITATQEPDSSEAQQWATIVEPVTIETLIDTLVSRFSTLTTLCSVCSSTTTGPNSTLLAWIQGYSSVLVTKTTNLLGDTRQEASEELSELALAKAIYISHYLELAFRWDNIDAQTYGSELEAAFSDAGLALGSSREVSMAKVNGLLAFNEALADSATTTQSAIHAGLRWSILLQAQSILDQVAQLPDVVSDRECLGSTHYIRGDISLLLHNLSYSPLDYGPAQQGKEGLLRNAELYYRNASKLFGAGLSGLNDEKTISELKGAIVKGIQAMSITDGGGACLTRLEEARAASISIRRSRGNGWVEEQMEAMVEKKLILNKNVFSS
ncbi:hypothetical protein F4778DRAFT_761457 [Xylariomycetidae sp. FL2044]|nr:hypothetical protein F4778DRAFT_761457 [Xylariomycetidae sp. FL2044]